MSKYLAQLRVVRKQVREFVGTGYISTNCFHSGMSLAKFLPRETTLEFGLTFDAVWKNQSMYIEILKVCIILSCLDLLFVVLLVYLFDMYRACS